MDLSRTNRVCMGVGDGVISVDGVVPAPLVGVTGGGTQWLVTDVSLIYARKTGDRTNQVESIDLATGAIEIIDYDGANQIVANGRGVWAIWSEVNGYRDSLGRTSDDYYPLDIDDVTDAIAVCPDRRSGAGLRLLTAAGHVDITHGSLDRQEACARDGVTAFREGGSLWVWRNGQRELACDLPGLTGVQHSRGYYNQWHEGRRTLFLVRERGTSGLVISSDGRDYGHTLRTGDDGLIEIRSSSGAGEAPYELRRYRVNPILATVNGEARPWVDLLAKALPVDEPPCDVPTFAVPNHPIKVAVFGEPGFNLNTGQAQHDDFSVPPWGTFVPMNTAEETAQLAKVRGLDVFVYSDADAFDFKRCEEIVIEASSFRGLVIPTIRVYPPASIDHATSDVRAAAKSTAYWPELALCAAAYRQIRPDGTFPWKVPQVLALLHDSWALACETPEVGYFLIFHHSRAGGKDGVVSRPESLEAVRRIKAAAAAYRPTPSAPEPKPPVVETGEFPRARMFSHA